MTCSRHVFETSKVFQDRGAILMLSPSSVVLAPWLGAFRLLLSRGWKLMAYSEYLIFLSRLRLVPL
jgi:hypothetical protein